MNKVDRNTLFQWLLIASISVNVFVVPILVFELYKWNNREITLGYSRILNLAMDYNFKVMKESSAENSKKFTRKYNTIAHKRLDYESATGLVKQKNYDFIDSMADRVVEKFANRAKLQFDAYTPEQQSEYLMLLIGRVLQENYDYKREAFLLLGAMDDSKFNCDTMTFMFLAMAEVLKIPIKLILVPKHVFVKTEWRDVDVYWETTDNSIKSKEEIDKLKKEGYVREYEISEALDIVKMNLFLGSLIATF